MRGIHHRAFKEWAVVCEALAEGRQTVLIRKGGIREEEGVFRVDDGEFFLMPTYDHQSPRLLKQDSVPHLERIIETGSNPRETTLRAYAFVDSIAIIEDEKRLRALDHEHIWNDAYVKLRLDYNPYDPLYVLLLRVYALPEAVTLPMRPEYEGCKSWVTLERPLSTAGARPAVSDAEFARRREAVIGVLSPVPA